MNMNDLAPILERIKNRRHLFIPKTKYSRADVEFVFGTIDEEKNDCWRVLCHHEFHEPATIRKIDHAEKALGLQIPKAYKDFLQISNGAKLFCAPRVWLDDVSPGAMHVRYHLFGCNELVEINKRLFDYFLDFYADEEEMTACKELNYIAICDAGDLNYQSLLVDEESDPQVFFLFHEFAYRPYDRRDADLNYEIAPSFLEWLKVIDRSSGWEGRGILTGGL